MTLYGYARVSVREPEDKNLDLQVERLVRAGCSLGNIRAEEASGARNDRGGLLELLDLVVEGDTLVVTHIDRLSRGLTHGLQVIEGLHRAGVEFRSKDFAHQMRWLADAAYPEAEKVRVVLDNLNTHRHASLYQTFEPKEARRVIQRLEFHYTPKHGSWLNMAEIEFSVFSNQCLNRRIEDEETLKREIAALETERNQAAATIDWRFSTNDARNKLRRIYPSVSH